jgi:carbon monoxide dehydrogenase subunit G
MRIEGRREFAARREDVFRALTDPRLVADSVPLVGSVDVHDADHWSAEVRIPHVARAPKLRLQFEIEERREPEHARLGAQGKSLGTSVKVASTFDLAESDGKTEMRYSAEVALGGLLGRIPDSTLEPAARKAVDKLLASIDRRVAR